MAPNLPPDDMQKAWLHQEVEPERISVEKIQRETEQFNRRTRLKNLFTYFGYAALVAIYLGLMWHPRRAAAESPRVARVSMALILVGMSYTVYQYRKRASALPMSTEIVTEDCLSFHRRQLERVRDYYRTGWWWGVAPIIPGFAAGFIGLAISLPGRRRFTELSAAVFVVFLYCAWKGMHRRADKLQHKLDALDRKEKRT